MRNISNRVVANIFKSLSEQGKDVDQLKSICHISEYELALHHGRIDKDPYGKLMDLLYKDHRQLMLTELMQDPAKILAGFYASFPELVSYCINSESIFELLTRYLEFRFIVGSCDELTCQSEQQYTRLRYTDEFISHKTSYSALANFINLYGMAKIIDPNLSVEIKLTGNPVLKKSIYEEVFNTKVIWNSPYNDMYFLNHQVKKRSQIYNPNIIKIQRSALIDIGFEIGQKNYFSTIIKTIIRDKVEKNRPSNESNLLNSVCSEVNISRWTLYRKLSQENTTFSALLKSVRLDMSLHFLLHSRCSVQEISDRTGFGSSSAFSRFFYTNMGMAPLNYRKVKSQIN